MSWDRLAALLGQGWAVGAHGASHKRLSECSGDVLRREVEAPRQCLDARLKTSTRLMAYPFGGTADVSDDALALAKASGYEAVFANHAGDNAVGRNDFVLARIDLGGDHAPLAWKAMAHGINLTRWRNLWPS